jgi:hypothetical protein
MSMRLPAVQQSFFPLEGGLDLVTPAIALSPGKLFDSQNFEPEISGGYRRIDGYERFDGRPSPTSAQYWVISASITGSVTLGATLTGDSSGATGRILGVFGSTIVLGRVTGTYTSGEALKISGTTVATATSAANQNGAPSASDDADYMLLAANDYRADIGAVSGSGPIRGVWVYQDTVYAFRDNAGGTAGIMWKATSGGWVQVIFGSELLFTNPTAQINAGVTITGATSGATAIVVVPLLRTGTWTSAGAGSLVITPISGTFVSGEFIKVSGTNVATTSSVSAPITRAPGGKMEFVNANFTGSTSATKMYGVDGVNTAFEFDGTTYVPIHTGMATDTPSHVMFHKTYLFLSFLGSVQFSSLGDPYSWTAVLGAGEIATGSPVTGFLPQGGTSSGSALAIFTADRTFILYGTSATDFTMVTSLYDLGYSAFTCQQISNDAWGLTARGVQALVTTLTYGDFDYEALSYLVQPFITAKRGLETASTSSRTKSQYRLYFSDGYALVIGITGDKASGCLVLNYNKPVRCITTATLTTGAEVVYFGSDDGYVYKDNTGTSQDGNPIEAWIRPVFNNVKSPQVIKRFRRAIFDVKTTGYARVNISYDLGYANPDAQPSAVRPDTNLTGAGGYWDQFTWDQFTWDTQVVTTAAISVEGSAKNIGFLFYTNRAQDKSITVQGITVTYTPRRLGRMDT